MKSFQYIINLWLKDNNISASIGKMQANFTSLDNSVNKVSSTVNQVSAQMSENLTEVNTNIQNVANSVEDAVDNVSDKLTTVTFTSLVDMAKNLADAFKDLSGPGMELEQSLADLSAITGIVGDDLKMLEKVARKTGVESGLGAAGAANAFAILAGQIEYSTIGMEGLLTLQEKTITLAQAGGVSMEEAATALAGTINQFGLSAAEADRVINVLAAGSKLGAAEIEHLIMSFKVAGASAAAAGVSVEQATAALEVLSQSNLKGVESGTALRNIILKLQTQLGIDLGETSLSQALEGLKPKLQDVTYLAKLFGVENVAAAQFLITNAQAVDDLTTAVTGTNTAEEQAAIRMDTAAEKAKRMQAAIDDAKIGFFQLTGGLSAYGAAMGDTAILATQLLPVLAALKSSLVLVTTATGRATVAATAKMIAEKGATAATVALTAVQAALNAVFKANPIGLIVIAIGAFVAGLRVAYVHSESFRNIVDKCWMAIKEFGNFLLGKFKEAMEWLEEAAKDVSDAWSDVTDFFGWLFGVEKKVVEVTDDLADANKDAASGTKELVDETKDLGKELNDNSLTIKDVEDKINSLKEAQKTASGELAKLFSLEIQAWQEKLDAMNAEINAANINLKTIGGIEQKISDLKTAQKAAMGDQAIALQREIGLWEQKLNLMNLSITKATSGNIANVTTEKLNIPDVKGVKTKPIQLPLSLNNKDIKDAVRRSAEEASAALSLAFENKKEVFAAYQEGVMGIASAMQNLSGVLNESAGAWLSWGANLLQTIAQAIPAIIALGNVQVTSAIAQTTGNTAVAASGGAAAVAAIPVVGPIMAVAAIASIIAALASIPKPKKFATGGVVYGSTFAQVGEYPGAANNPEVIAPLSKLRDLIEPQGSGFGQVRFRIEGRDLVGVLDKINTVNRRTR
ncbi:phage tail tape measure protein [Massilibacteroides sp.]|uniref:phage tail tape measure protein n=1 Tax=Massilibacteroides sp. TaxID=2034766 RepID=UPI00262D9DCF|nr:phage tail tape measure protein [Massilibacteroides sp.]MDD4516467.1 phage tail tape measure protein [Massilibacteroides sp.]